MFSKTLPEAAGRNLPSMKAWLGSFSRAAIERYLSIPGMSFMAASLLACDRGLKAPESVEDRPEADREIGRGGRELDRGCQISRFATLSALDWMNSRRGST